MKLCSIVGCDRKHAALGLCVAHYKRQWRASNPEKRRRQQANHLARHPDRVHARAARYRGNNRAMLRQRARVWRAAHREAVNAANRSWYAKNRERVVAARAVYAAAHREEARARTRAWALRNPEHARQLDENKRARRRGAVGSHTHREWLDKVAVFAGCCAYCGRDDLPLGRDHQIPLSRGGSNLITNVVPACAPCNFAKHTMTDHEFLARRAG